MNANKMLCKSRFFIYDANVFFMRMQVRNVCMMHMSLFRDAVFMMRMSHTMVQMQHLSMMVPVHVFTRDANVSLQRWRCKKSYGANAF